MRYLLLFAFLCLTSLLFAQNDTVVATDPPRAPADWDALSEQMAAFFYAGKYPEAVECARLGLEIARRDSGETSLAYGTSLDNLGVVLHHAGKLEEALSNLTAAVGHARAHLGVEHEDYITRLSNLGMLCRDLGDYAGALSWLNESVQKAEQTLSDDNIYLGVLFNNLALVSEESGLYVEASRLYKRALELTERTDGKKSAKYALRLDNLATLWSRCGLNEQSLSLRLEALPIFEEQLGKTHPVTINAVNNLASTYGQLKQYDKALALRLEVLPVAASVLDNDHHIYLGYLTSTGINYLQNGQYENALAALNNAHEALKKFYPSAFRSLKNCARGLAVTHLRMGHDSESTRFTLLQNRYLLDELDYSFDELSQDEQQAYFNADDEFYFDEIYSGAFLHPEDAALAAVAFEDNLALKGLLLGNRRKLLQSLRESNKTDLQNQFSQWQEAKRIIYQQYSLPPAKRNTNLDSLVLHANYLERGLSRASGEFRDRQAGIAWQTVQEHLQPGEAAIEFCRFRLIPGIAPTDSVLYVAWLVRPGDTMPQQIFLFEEKELGKIGATRRLYELNSAGDARTLNKLIWKPLEPFLEHVNTVYYAPAGLLHRINIGAVPISNDEVIADRFLLHDLGSTRQIASHVRSDSRSFPHQALVLGGIRYETDSLALTSGNSAQHSGGENASALRALSGNGSHLKKWEYLPWTLKEAAAVSKSLTTAGFSVEMRSELAATEAFFKQKTGGLQSPDVMHLATHGYFFPDADQSAASGFRASGNPFIRSGLILAGANRVWLGGTPLPGQEDGILTAYEISQLDLRGTELVVLSACETALGDLDDNEGVFGLQRAFKIAGAKYLIMSLWNVQDQAAQEFMTAFYDAWLQEKKDIPQAFRTAQHRLHRQYAKPFNPVMWAGFILLE